jgi:Fe-S-cluster-containing dehydrogenase component
MATDRRRARDRRGAKEPRRATKPGIYVDRARCIGCNACSLACKQENNFEHSPAVVAGTGRYMAAGEKWNEVFHYEEGTYPAVRAQVFAITLERCTMCAHRLAAGLLPACVITCMGITREFGDYEALKRKYPDAEHMEDGAKESVLYGNLGREPELERSPLPPSGYLPANDCRQCHR